MFSRPFVVILCLLCATATAEEIYKWVDEDGVIHYSDQPAPGAEVIQLPDRPAPRQSRPAPRPASAAPSLEAQRAAASRPFSYESLAFSSPNPEQTLWNIGGTLNVAISLNPGLRQGHRVRLYFDGEPREISGTQVQLTEVYRGTHNLQAEVLDANGNLMIRSEPIRFYVQQTSIRNP